MMRSKDRIVFLDAGTVDYGDLGFGPLESLGKLKIYHDSRPEQIPNRVRNATMIVTNKCRFDRQLIASLKKVRAIHLTATGFNNIDVEAARKKKIAVTNVRNYCSEIMAQSTLALILALAGSLVDYHEAVRRGDWSRSPFFTLGRYPILELKGKTLGLVGYGAIGKKVARLARAFGMKVLVAKIPGRNYGRDHVKRVSFLKTVRAADFLTLHVPLSRLTQDLINASVIRKMKPGAFLVNMARGGIVNEKALLGALKSGRLAGAASDVLSEEPPRPGHPLLKAPKFLLTPHVAWASLPSRERVLNEVAQNIGALQKGRRRNRIV